MKTLMYYNFIITKIYGIQNALPFMLFFLNVFFCPIPVPPIHSNAKNNSEVGKKKLGKKLAGIIYFLLFFVSILCTFLTRRELQFLPFAGF